MKHLSAITTASRHDSQLLRTLQSVRDAGFEPTIFAEPGSDLTGVFGPVVQRPEKLGCYQNYLQTLSDLLAADPEADVICVFQDDIVLARDAKAFLDAFLWPHERAGVVSLYSPHYRGYEIAVPPGFNRQTDPSLIGACALALRRDFVERLVTYTDWRGWAANEDKSMAQDRTRRKAVDAWVGRVAKEEGFRVYYPNPSVCQHIGDSSAVGHGSTSQTRNGCYYRRSEGFRGEDVSPFEVFGQPKFRYDIAGSIHLSDPLTVIIPAWNCLPLTLKCLTAVAENAKNVHPLEVVYVDNGSDEGVIESVIEHAHDLGLNMRVIIFSENRGYTEAINAGIEATSDGPVLLLNNDCYMHPDCLLAMVRHLFSVPHRASVGPLTNDQGWQSIMKYPSLERQRGKRSVTVRERLSGFCQLISREAIRRVGLLDSALPHGLGTDNDWCKRAIAAGLHHAIAHDAFADHDHMQTFKCTGQDREELQRQAVEYLKTKPLI